MAASDFILYSYFRSSASYRVRIALGLKDIPYEYRAVHLINNGGEQLRAEYKALNPSGDVPTLVHKGNVIGQSVAIIDYLDRIKPAPSLFPSDTVQRAAVLQACEIANSGVQPLHNLRVLKKLSADFGASEEQKNQWACDWIKYGLETLEAFLSKRAGRFSFGDAVSAADCFLMPHLANADRYKIALSPYPTLARVRASCEAQPAFVKAHPMRQPDTPDEMRI